MNTTATRTDPGFWDCNCKGTPADYIHPKSEDICEKCGATSDEQPDSRFNEITPAMRLAEDTMTFEISITLGNDGMQTGDDVAAALRAVADKCADRDLTTPTNLGTRWGISDANGNRVGTWTVTK
ncbi:MAG: hypothetical protein NVS1B2_16160 [Vulcanimicrobiaceae bacterium]